MLPHPLRAAIIVTLAASLGATVAAPATADPLGAHASPHTVVLDGHRLKEIRREIRQGDPTATTALDNLLAQADPELTQGPWSVTDKTQVPPSGDKHDYMSLAPYYWATRPPTPANPWGCPFVNRDGQRNPLVDSISDHAERMSAFTAIYQLTLAWYYTGKATYAHRAELDLRTWFTDTATRMNPNLNFAQGIPCQVDGRGIGIIEFSDVLTEVVDATAVLDAGAPGWTEHDHAGMSDWYGRFLTWLQTSKNGREEQAEPNNHGTFWAMMTAALALYLKRDDIASTIALDAETRRMPVQLKPDGTQPLELARTRSWHYSAFDLVAWTRLAAIADHLGGRAGIDLWDYQTPEGGSIRKAIDFLIPTATGGQTQWPYPESNFHQYAALDILHAAAAAGDPKAIAALPSVPAEPGGDLYPIRPAVEQLDDIAKG